MTLDHDNSTCKFYTYIQNNVETTLRQPSRDNVLEYRTQRRHKDNTMTIQRRHRDDTETTQRRHKDDTETTQRRHRDDTETTQKRHRDGTENQDFYVLK